jgi:hypothetical protein
MNENQETHSSTKARMSQEDRLKYMVPVYAKRLGDTIDIMKGYLQRGEGAHFDYIVTVFPHRTAEMRELIYQRRMTAWKTTDRMPKVPEPEPPASEEAREDEVEETEPDAA